jgi:ankyrin repeat protein
VLALFARPLFEAHAKNADQRTPLSIAASYGHASVIKNLIRGASVNVNDADVDGITPIHLATSEGHHEVIAALLDEGGAHVNVADNHGFTALHLAVFHRHEMAVKSLLDRGASANCRTTDGKTVRDMAYGMKSSER